MSTTQMPIGPLIGSNNILSTPWRNYLSPLTAISWDTTSLTIDISGSSTATTQLNFVVNDGGSALTALTLLPGTSVLHLGVTDSPDFYVKNSSPGTGGPSLTLKQDSASPAINDINGILNFNGNNNLGVEKNYAGIFSTLTNVTSGTEAATLSFKVYQAGARATPVIMAAGVQVGAPTGGDKGTGTINVSSGVFLNGAAYTNPDYALEHFFTGEIVKFAANPGAANYLGLMPLDVVESYLAETFRLPGIHRESMDIFERSDVALEKIEQAWLYIVQLHNRLSEAEAKLKELTC